MRYGEPLARCSSAQRFDDEVRCLATREVLLSGDQIAIADCKPPPESGLHVVRAQLLQLVLNAPGHKMLVSWECAHAPHRVVREVFLDIGEAGHGLALSDGHKSGSPSEIRLPDGWAGLI